MIKERETLSFDNREKKEPGIQLPYSTKFQNERCGAYEIVCTNQTHDILHKRKWPKNCVNETLVAQMKCERCSVSYLAACVACN